VSESIAYALGALLLYGVADFVYKRGAAAGALPHQFLMVQTWFFSSLALLYGKATGTLAFNAGALWGAAAGVLVVVGYYNFAWSLKHGSVSTNATIFRLSFAVTVALAVLLLGEPLSLPALKLPCPCPSWIASPACSVVFGVVFCPTHSPMRNGSVPHRFGSARRITSQAQTSAVAR